MCVLIFSMTFVWNISNFKKNSVRYYHKYSQIFHVKYRWKDRQTDRQDKANIHFLQFCKCAYKLHTQTRREYYIYRHRKQYFLHSCIGQREGYIHWILISKTMLTGVMSGAVHTWHSQLCCWADASSGPSESPPPTAPSLTISGSDGDSGGCSLPSPSSRYSCVTSTLWLQTQTNIILVESSSHETQRSMVH